MILLGAEGGFAEFTVANSGLLQVQAGDINVATRGTLTLGQWPSPGRHTCHCPLALNNAGIGPRKRTY